VKNKRNKNNKLRSLIINVVIWIVVLVAASVTIISISTKDQGVANILGNIPLSIQTDSMEPGIKVGDLILTSEYINQELKKDDVISFFAIEQNKKIIKTHRITEVLDSNGMISYATKGDNSPAQDELHVAPGDIISIYSGKRVPLLGKVLDFLKSQWGFFIFIVLPLFIFFIYQLYTFIVLIIDSKKEQIIASAKK